MIYYLYKKADMHLIVYFYIDVIKLHALVWFDYNLVKYTIPYKNFSNIYIKYCFAIILK